MPMRAISGVTRRFDAANLAAWSLLITAPWLLVLVDPLPLLHIAFGHSGASPDVVTSFYTRVQLILLQLGAACGLVVLWTAMRRSRVAHGLFLLLALGAAVDIFYRLVYQGALPAGALIVTLGTTRREASELLRSHWAITATETLLVVFASIYAIRGMTRTNAPADAEWRRPLIWVCAIASSLSAIMLVAYVPEARVARFAAREELLQMFPFDLANAFRKVAVVGWRVRMDTQARSRFEFPRVRRVWSDTPGTLPELYVVVIGESSRRSNWSLYGYGRDTTPRLRARAADLVVFQYATSNATLTFMSVSEALTRTTAADTRPATAEKSIVNLLRSGGFSVAWLSNQERFGELVGDFAHRVSTIAHDASFTEYMDELPPNRPLQFDGYDENLLPELRRYISTLGPSSRAFVFLHTNGSHLGYQERFPPEFNRFSGSPQRTAPLSETQARMRNLYDDTVAYTDFIVGSVIEQLEACSCQAAMAYFSDHGERLLDASTGTDFGHGFASVSVKEIEIPLFFWFSRTFQDRHRDMVNTLRSHADSPVQLQNLFETLVDLGGLTYDGRDLSSSLFSAEFVPPKRRWVMDLDDHLVFFPAMLVDAAK